VARALSPRERPRWVDFLVRWGVSVASLAGGVVTLFVFRRGLPDIGWIVGYLLLLWLLVALLSQFRQPLEARGHRFVVTAADYTIQTLYHGVLLFVLPPYWASATLPSVNALFPLLLALLALLATFDPWYQAAVGARPWVGHVYFLVAHFAGLNVALPLVGVPPFGALLASAGTSVIALTPVVRRARDLSWARALAATVGAAVVAVAAVALFRLWIPPAPLTLARATMARDVRDGRPVDALQGPVAAAELREGRGLVAYTAVYAPSGLRQPILHVWRHDGRPVDRVRLSPVLGGRREGFRTYSRKSEFPSDPAGRWSVDVMTSSGQLIGRLRFQVVP
jgi:hypothetical protein